MTLLVKDANTTVQSLSTVTDGSGNLVPLHAPAVSNAQGVATPAGPLNPLPVVNTAATAASDGSGVLASGGTAQTLFGGAVPANGFLVQNNSTAAPASSSRRTAASSRPRPATSPPAPSASTAAPTAKPSPPAAGDLRARCAQ
jgi:hypothetical protein